mgnify:FL=1
MDKVLMFSCLHLATPEVARYVREGLPGGEGREDYPIPEMLSLIDEAGVIVSMGDFAELLYEGTQGVVLFPKLVEKLRTKKFILLQGNHERHLMGLYRGVFPDAEIAKEIMIDGWKLLHGDGGPIFPTVMEYRAYIRQRFEGTKTIHGHSHVPYVGSQVMDVGSITHSRTVGWLEDGVPRLSYLDGS